MNVTFNKIKRDIFKNFIKFIYIMCQEKVQKCVFQQNDTAYKKPKSPGGY